mmetsp:Transcript_19982/g.40022  ORF Transcript_19982/g.40022 Transcript_19982/m.40022 type:complete len:442 (-) Transcript_19982:156-1481(-)|eukprot:CAMPEP_0182473366 /NCGR_PEP_ID=MMETSP1319-20130603/23776_1 /TAXON_ID=172717 /ORGANISM="Bolidomonas pacifica, Strain RCC208" /LENGTH=441 /DNA_ID=CAMNT_0024674147 /DNA_START=133 /DNA_END=1458 /DNA_ORIENTATION=-
MFTAVLRRPVPSGIRARLLSTVKKRDLPDYNTTVDVANIKLSRPEKKSLEERQAKMLRWRRKDLDGKSLINDTLQEMEEDVDFQRTLKELKTSGKAKMTLEERKNRRRALDSLGAPSFQDFVAMRQFEENQPKAPIVRKTTTILQLNVGLYCNQACGHCHVESSPRRKEMMDLETANHCLTLLENSPSVTTLDITGGAPELQESFRHLVTEARRIRPDLDIIDRCNLTVVHEPGQEDLIDFLVENKVHVIASLPCYSEKNVNQQRGSGVFDRSVSALLALNEAGYAKPGSGLTLDLVYNPLGAFLPPPQETLEAKYKEELDENFGITFNNLFTMTNMPVKRFADFLHRRGELEEYMDLLIRNFNLDTTDNLMCTNTISVGYDGKIFDCDFNNQLGFAVGSDKAFDENVKTVANVKSLDDLLGDSIALDSHCYGCTAGMGSS